MNLVELAESDLSFILEDSATGFGWSITVTDPDGLSAVITGFANDIAQLIDPDTGQAVSGRLASIALRISSLSNAGLGMPQGISNTSIKPWLISFDDVNGNNYTFKVMKSNPDRFKGLVTCVLEVYEP